jgi:plasmid stability protein
MKLVQIQLDDATHAALRRRADEEHRSISSAVREELGKALLAKKPRKRLTLKDFRFVGTGRTKQRVLLPVSERHDEALAEAISQDLHG